MELCRSVWLHSNSNLPVQPVDLGGGFGDWLSCSGNGAVRQGASAPSNHPSPAGNNALQTCVERDAEAPGDVANRLSSAGMARPCGIAITSVAGV